jgi:hypothetical protein
MREAEQRFIGPISLKGRALNFVRDDTAALDPATSELLREPVSSRLSRERMELKLRELALRLLEKYQIIDRIDYNRYGVSSSAEAFWRQDRR